MLCSVQPYGAQLTTPAYPSTLDQPFQVPGRWSLVVLAGDDAASWIHGQCTQAIADLADAEQREAAWCDSKGKIWGFGPIRRDGRRLVVAIHRSAVDRLLMALEDWVVMEDVVLESVHEATCLYNLNAMPSGLFVEEPSLGLPGVLVPRDDAPTGLPLLDESSVDWLELRAGTPRLGVDTNSDTLCAELGPAFLERHVSYTKGCYTGQEVLARIKSRGHTNRTWVVLSCKQALRAGDLVQADGHNVGSVLRASNGLGSALLRNEAAQPGSMVTVFAQSGPAEAAVLPLPVSHLDEKPG